MPNHRDWQRAESYYREGNLDAAKVVCESLLGTSQEHAGVHWMLSRVYQARTRFRLAVRHARLSASDLPQLALEQKVVVTRGLISVGDYQAAIAALRGIGMTKAIDTQTLTEIIDQFTALDEHEHALRWLEHAAGQGICSSEIAFLRGNNLKFVGDLTAAADAYDDAIAKMPVNPHPYLARATLALMEGTGSRVDKIRRRLSMLPRTFQKDVANDAAVLHYALFRELDTLGDIDAAWSELCNAMRAKQLTIRHDSHVENGIFDRLIDTYTEEYLSGGMNQDEARTPVFIVGMPRSGTTLVERVLGNHPQLSACGELSELRMAFKWASDYYCNAFLDGEAAARIAGVDAQALGKAYLDRTAWRASGRSWHSDKHPGNIVFCGLILRAIPQAKVINIRRNPMDSCFSNMRELFAQHYYEYSYAIDDVVNHYRNYTRLTDHVSKAAPGRILDVDYEDFVCHPESETLRILDFCGLARTADITDISRNRASVSTASSVQVRDPIHTTRVAYWKRYEKHLGPLADRLDVVCREG